MPYQFNISLLRHVAWLVQRPLFLCLIKFYCRIVRLLLSSNIRLYLRLPCDSCIWQPGVTVPLMYKLDLHFRFMHRLSKTPCVQLQGVWKNPANLRILNIIVKHKICSSLEFKTASNDIKEINHTAVSPCIKFHSIVFMHRGFSHSVQHSGVQISFSYYRKLTIH